MNLYDPPAQFFDLFFPVRYARLDSNTSWKEDVSSNSISSGGLSLRSFAASFVIKAAVPHYVFQNPVQMRLG